MVQSVPSAGALRLGGTSTEQTRNGNDHDETQESIRGGYSFVFGFAAKCAAALALAFAAVPADAAVKYRTTGAPYGVGDYVKDGLVLHYDGEFNDGADSKHAPAASVWKNIAPGYESRWPMSWVSYIVDASDSTKVSYKRGNTSQGEWLENGFKFNGYVYFAKWGDGDPFPLPAVYTIQQAFDITTADNINGIEYTWWPGTSGWQQGSVGMRKAAGGGTSANSVYFTHEGSGSIVAGRPYFVNAAPTYVTAILDNDRAMCFEGVAKPTAAGNDYKVGTTAWTAKNQDWYAVGGKHNVKTMSEMQSSVGTLYNTRLYTRVLDDFEIEWNRAVDDWRFHGKETAVYDLPVTNAVIASSAATVSGNEKNGAYSVDAEGYTFTAPATQTVNKRTYTCSGYTLETWADGAWGEPQTNSGTSVAVSAADCVRITWQWAAGDGLVSYDVEDYVQDGLVLHYDGIRNAGADKPHDPSATTWVNIAPRGGWDATLGLRAAGVDPGAWDEDGYAFEGHSHFSPNAAFPIPKTETVQTLIDADPSDQRSSDKLGYVWFCEGHSNTDWKKGGSLSVHRDMYDADKNSESNNGWIDFGTQAYGDRVDATRARGNRLDYTTAIMSPAFVAVFDGTTIPTSGSRWTGYVAQTGPSEDVVADNFGIGGPTGSGWQKLNGTLKSFRLYNRVLTDGEVAWNRVVDEARFFGRIPVTNVVVATSHSFLQGAEKSGNYQVSGRYEFTAPSAAQTDSRGFGYALSGYALETWDESAEGWSAPVAHDGETSFEYVAGTSPAKVRLTWLWKATNAVFAAGDFGLSDYVPAGLVLHYDGIKNAGAVHSHSSVSESWKNIADPGFKDLQIARSTGANTAPKMAPAWLDDAYLFGGEGNSNIVFRQTGLVVPSRQTTQALVEANYADIVSGYLMYIWFPGSSGGVEMWSKWSASIRAAKQVWYNTQDYTADRPKWTAEDYTYFTGLDNATYSTAFEGTKEPTAAPGRYNVKSSFSAIPARSLAIWALGGQGNAPSGNDRLVGKIKNFRFYDRALSEAELVRNRLVDESRFFGRLAFTNLVVDAAGFDSTPGSGEYWVDGGFELSAAASGASGAPTGYKLQDWDAASGEWTNLRHFEGAAFSYVPEDGKTVKVTWFKAKPFVIIVR